MNVYIVLEESGDYEDHREDIVGVFTDVDEARTCQGGNYEREIETWSVGPNSERQFKTLHVVNRMVANPNFDHADEVVWCTKSWSREVDDSVVVTTRDYANGQSVRRGGWTPEHAQQRLYDALEEFTPDLAPLPKEFRWPSSRACGYVEMFANMFANKE